MRKSKKTAPLGLTKISITTSVPQYYVERLREMAEKSHRGFAEYLRLVLMNHVDIKS